MDVKIQYPHRYYHHDRHDAFRPTNWPMQSLRASTLRGDSVRKDVLRCDGRCSRRRTPKREAKGSISVLCAVQAAWQSWEGEPCCYSWLYQGFDSITLPRPKWWIHGAQELLIHLVTTDLSRKYQEELLINLVTDLSRKFQLMNSQNKNK